MGSHAALGALAALVVAQADASWLTIEGEKVLPEEVYRAVLELPPDAGPDPATADLVQHQLAEFLRRSGYELADVEVTRGDDGALHAVINEGQLEKVVFKGRLTLSTIRFKLGLDVPHDVFNRPALERQVARLEKQLGLSDIRLVLQSTHQLPHRGPQLTMPVEVLGFELIHERRPYELHIVLPQKDWDTGLGADLRIGYVNGVELGLNYQGKSGLVDDDRFRLASGAGVGLRNSIDENALYAHFSRASFDGRYFFPPTKHHLRPMLELMTELLARQRRDLNLENYYAHVVTGALWLEWEPEEGIRFQLGGGVFYRRLFSFTPGPSGTLPEGVEPETRLRPFVAGRLEFTFDPDNERWDRHHLLQAELQQQLPGPNAGALAWAGYRYQWVRGFGWHDLWLKSAGYIAWYQTSFQDEPSLGEFMRGVFGRDFVSRAAAFAAEFRFSITRDIWKASLFSGFSLYNEADQVPDAVGPLRGAFMIGPGIHWLVGGLLQLDLYVAFGARPRGTQANPENFAVAVSMLLQKAF